MVGILCVCDVLYMEEYVLLFIQLDQELELVLQRDGVKKNFVDAWNKYYLAILDYGPTTGNRKIIEAMELSGQSMSYSIRVVLYC